MACSLLLFDPSKCEWHLSVGNILCTILHNKYFHYLRECGVLQAHKHVIRSPSDSDNVSARQLLPAAALMPSWIWSASQKPSSSTSLSASHHCIDRPIDLRSQVIFDTSGSSSCPCESYLGYNRKVSTDLSPGTHFSTSQNAFSV